MIFESIFEAKVFSIPVLWVGSAAVASPAEGGGGKPPELLHACCLRIQDALLPLPRCGGLTMIGRALPMTLTQVGNEEKFKTGYGKTMLCASVPFFQYS